MAAYSPSIFDFEEETVVEVKESRELQTKQLHRRVACLNIANTEGDLPLPLSERLDQICTILISEEARGLDALFVFEAGRPPCTKERWTSIAARIEDITGLAYICIYYNGDNARPDATGTALFMNRSRLSLVHTQHWPVNDSVFNLAGSCLIATFCPVVEDTCPVHGRNRRTLSHRTLTVGAFQMMNDKRLREKAADWLAQISHDVEVLMVDFNVTAAEIFDVHGRQLVHRICRDVYKHMEIAAEDGLQQDTYHAFEHDAVAADTMVFVPQDWISEDKLTMRPSSPSDHLFCNRHRAETVVKGQFILPMQGASDHDTLVAELNF